MTAQNRAENRPSSPEVGEGNAASRGVGLLGCDVPGHPNSYAHRCDEWDECTCGHRRTDHSFGGPGDVCRGECDCRRYVRWMGGGD